MVIKYSIHNQLTGLSEEALTFEDAKVLQNTIKQAYIDSISGLWQITALVQNDDGTWTQSLADENGDPLPPPVIPTE